MVVMEQRELDKLQVQAETAYPEECCAIVIGKRDGEVMWITQALPALNMHEEPHRAYAISPQALIAAQRRARQQNLEILGFVHSHPDRWAEPSATDSDEALWLDHLYGIMSVRQGVAGTLRFFRLQGDGLDKRCLVREPMRVTNEAQPE